MAITPSDLLRAADAPFDSATVAQSLDLTTTSGSIALVEGVYEVVNSGTVYAWGYVGAAAVFPTSGAAAVGGSPLPPGAVVEVRIASGGQSLHAKTLSSTATLYIVRKVIS